MKYLGYSISIILVINTFVFFVLSVYVSYKGMKSLPSRRAQIDNTKYLFLSSLSACLGLFVFLISENGFSWNALGISLGLLAMLCLFLGANFVITSKTTEYLNKRGYSPDILNKIKQIGKTHKESGSSENSSSDK